MCAQNTDKSDVCIFVNAIFLSFHSKSIVQQQQFLLFQYEIHQFHLHSSFGILRKGITTFTLPLEISHTFY